MNLEIERKFLVKNGDWRSGAAGAHIRQGYLFATDDLAVRVRQMDGTCYLTIKADQESLTRAEFEYEIPAEDANEMLARLCAANPIEKTRYLVQHEGQTWEVDEFHGSNEGLILAEIELTSPGQSFALPDWIGPEVTDDVRFYNANLYEEPFQSWDESYPDLLSAAAAGPAQTNLAAAC